MPPIRPYERLLFAVIAASLVCRTVILTPAQPAWLDEVYSLYAIDHAHLMDFARSFATNRNAAPPSYFFSMWLLGKIVPTSLLSLRVVSSLCGAGAFAFVWSILRRRVGFFSATVGAGTGLLTSNLFLFHSTEARFYTIFLFGIAWTLWEFDRLCTVEPTRAGLIRNGLSHAFAVSTAYVAGMYSAALLCAFVLRDHFVGVRRPKVYASVLAGWFPVFLCLPLIRSIGTSAVAWIPKPPRTAIFHPFNPGIDLYHSYFVLFAMAVLAGLSRIGQNKERVAPLDPPPFHHLLIAALFLAVPYGVLILSWVRIPMLIDRYDIPALFAIVILVSYGLRALVGRTEAPDFRWTSLTMWTVKAAVVAALVVWPTVDAVAWKRHNLLSTRAASDPDFIRAAPVLVCSDPHAFFVRHFEAANPQPLVFVVHTDAQVDRLHIFRGDLNVVTVDVLLSRYPRFAIVADQQQFNWLADELVTRKEIVVERDERDGSRWTLVHQ